MHTQDAAGDILESFRVVIHDFQNSLPLVKDCGRSYDVGFEPPANVTCVSRLEEACTSQLAPVIPNFR